MRGSKRFDPEQWLAQWAEVHGVTTPSVRIDGSVGSVPVGAGGVVTLSGERFILLSRGPSEEDLLALSAAALNAVTLAAEFDEDEHPRNPAGGPHGGEFAKTGSGATEQRTVDEDGVTHVGKFVELYHGTDRQRATKITKEGFRIRAVKRQTMPGDSESNRDYLWFAKRLEGAKSYSEIHRNPTVITVRIPEALFKQVVTHKNSGPDSVWINQELPAQYVHSISKASELRRDTTGVTSLGGEFDEAEHPRDADGRFASSDANESIGHDISIAGYKVPLSPGMVHADGFTYNPSRLLLESLDYGAAEVIDEYVDNQRPNDVDPTSDEWAKESREVAKQYIDGVNAHLQGLVDAAKPVINIDAGKLAGAIESGDLRFKSQHETGTSNGWLNQDLRSSAEDRMFGHYRDVQARPIYGSLTSDPSHYRLLSYGDTVVELDPSVKQAATVSFGDSLAAYDAGGCMPRPASHVDFLAIQMEKTHFREGTLRADTVDAAPCTYVEMQIHGGVPFDKIKAVYVPKPDRPRRGPAADPDEEESNAIMRQDRVNVARIARFCRNRGIQLHFTEKPRW